MEPAAVELRSEGGIARITLDRPEKRNALSLGMLHALRDALAHAGADPAVRVVVLAARGPAFCAGHDLSEMVGASEDEYRTLFEACSAVMQQMRRLQQPVVARVQGTATAAGCQLVAACDLAVAAEGATFATPGVKIGLFCTTPMVPLVRAVPAKGALEMLLTGVPIDARQALAWGLVNRVVPPDELDAAVVALAAPILAVSPSVVALGKAAFYDLRALDEPSAYERACAIMTANALQADAQEGMSAFLQKRPPVWTGDRSG